MPIRVAIVGVGNCASALVQGVAYYEANGVQEGLVRSTIGPYKATDLEFVVGFDVDTRKIGKSINHAIFEKPNCCYEFYPDVYYDKRSGPVIEGPHLDGIAPHMKSTSDDSEKFCVRMQSPDDDVVHYAEILNEYNCDVLVNYLPVGSQKATEFWASACILARVPMVNCIPVFIASDSKWASKFRDAKVALIGDDMKSQFGASVMSQMLQELAESRGHVVKSHIQQNSGGNTDFLNMTNQQRLKSKKISKENVLRLSGIEPEFFHAGPSDYIRHYGDTKVANFDLELEGFCGSPVKFTARLEVQDSPNSAGVVIDAVRYVVLAQSRGIYGALAGPSAFTQKSPPEHMTLAESIAACDEMSRNIAKVDSSSKSRRVACNNCMEGYYPGCRYCEGLGFKIDKGYSMFE
jgi:myo-inositol-1-phosphate synthase